MMRFWGTVLSRWLRQPQVPSQKTTPAPKPEPVPAPAPEPEPVAQQGPLTGHKRLVAIAGTSAAALMLAIVPPWEGKRNDPYQDIVGVWTVCYGETRVPMRRYSDAECDEMLAQGLGDFAQGVLKRNPNLRDRPNQLAAATSLAYNIGVGAYNHSTVARRFDAGDWRGGCDAILMWNKAGGKVVRGLVNRRNHEREICLKGL
jgi:lysozyme